MAYRWETPASVWLEDEVSGQFELDSSDGLGQVDWRGHARAHAADVAALLGASLPASCACAAVYPEQFAFCPACGRALTMLPSAPLTAPGWFGPYNDAALPRQVPHGLPVTTRPLGAALAQAGAPVALADAIPVPPNANSVFAAGGFGFPVERLLALAVARNVLQYWDPQARLWQVLAADEQAQSLAFSASRYGWLPVRHPRRGEVAIVPTDAGLRRLWINPVNGSYSTDSLFDGAVISAPGQRRERIACLVAGAGGTRLWSANSDMSKQDLRDCGGAPGSRWSRPVAYDGRLTWLHARGQLSWNGEGAPEWIEWPVGWQPLGRLGGPVKSRDGRLWLLGHDAANGYSFVELFTAHPDMHAVDGARLGFAGLLFRRGHAVVDEPWDVERVEDQHEGDSLVLPLLRGFIDDRKQPNGLVLRLHAYTGRAEDAFKGDAIALVTLEWIGERNLVLDQLRFLKRPQDCVPIVYDGRLWLHHPDWPQLRGWSLAASS